jgi:hypothetical protein
MAFWIAWGIDALIALVFVYFFFVGLADGSVSSFNIGLWSAILLGLGALVGGGLALRASGRARLATALLLVLAVPGALAALLLLVAVVARPNWH